MLTLYDYGPSQNGYKVRLLLNHLGLEVRTRQVRIFDGEGQWPQFLAKNPTGAVPVLELEDGRTLAESNAILFYLAQGTRYLASDPWLASQQLRWMFWEEDFIQNGLASLRYWAQTGKLARRAPPIVHERRVRSEKSLALLDAWLTDREFLTEAGYSIADMCVFAYVSRADEAGLALCDYGAVAAWVARVSAQPGFLDEVIPYAVDPSSSHELG
ncbi:MAG TPA: glutathione S-transferase family protein [Steroidobacteraceae bacterium]|nr:glutathione S-transferase family protein [Steroidobacteraceae bacterium]